MTWRPPTLRDRSPAAAANPLVACACGRTTQADMFVAMPAALRAVHGLPAYLCDACRETLFRTGALTRGAYLRAVGAPADLVARAESS